MPQPAQPWINADRNLALELVRVTEAAALAASRWMGRGRKNELCDVSTSAYGRYASRRCAIRSTSTTSTSSRSV